MRRVKEVWELERFKLVCYSGVLRGNRGIVVAWFVFILHYVATLLILILRDNYRKHAEASRSERSLPSPSVACYIDPRTSAMILCSPMFRSGMIRVSADSPGHG